MYRLAVPRETTVPPSPASQSSPLRRGILPGHRNQGPMRSHHKDACEVHSCHSLELSSSTPPPAPGVSVRSRDHDDPEQGPRESGSCVATPIGTKVCSRTPCYQVPRMPSSHHRGQQPPPKLQATQTESLAEPVRHVSGDSGHYRQGHVEHAPDNPQM